MDCASLVLNILVVQGNFPRHLMILKEIYGVGIRRADELIVPSMVDAHLLDVQSSYFKINMKTNYAWVIEHHVNQSSLTLIWQNLA